MAQKKPAAKKGGTKKPAANAKAKRARNKDGTYKGDDKSTPDVNEAYESPKPGTKATSKPRNPAAKQREATTAKKAAAKKPAAKKKVTAKDSTAKKKSTTYAPKVREEAKPVTKKTVAPPPAPEKRFPVLPDGPPSKKGRLAGLWRWLVGE